MNKWFPRSITVTTTWIVVGLFVDGWAHTHGKVDTSFFTPYHALLYSGLLATAAVAGLALWRNERLGAPRWMSLPAGYELLIPGLIVFALGGIFDLGWHTLFGIEADTEALLSPSHLILAVGVGVVVGSTFRAAWLTLPKEAEGLLAYVPMLLSFTYVISLLTFFTQFAHPVAGMWGGESLHSPNWLFIELGVTGILLTAVLMQAAVLLLVKRWTLPWGALTIFFGLNTILIGLLRFHEPYPTVVVGIVALSGVLADILLHFVRPSQSARRLRIFSFLVPAGMIGLHFLAVSVVSHIWWSVHLWTGAIAMSGLAGMLLSYLSVSPFTSASIEFENSTGVLLQ